MPKAKEVIKKLKSLSSPEFVEGMERFGINSEKALGIPIPTLRKTAREIGKDHALAQQLWDSRIHEARILASVIDDSELVDEAQMERWVADFDSWDLCDQCINNLLKDTKYAWQKAVEWSSAEAEFVKRAGFAMMAYLAVSDKQADDKQFEKFLSLIKREASDDRNYVKKAVNWALRQIGKRNLNLNRMAIQTAKEIQALDGKTAKWIASDALRELTSEVVQKRLSSPKAFLT